MEVADTIPVVQDGDVIQVTRGQEASSMEAWLKTISPQQQAMLMFKGKNVETGIKRVKASYEPLGRIMRDTPSLLLDNNKGINQMFENITAQNKALDKSVQEFQKALFSLNPPVSVRQSYYADAFRQILNTLTDQNKGFTEIYSKTGSLPKSAQKTQKYINKLIGKYANEMMKNLGLTKK